MAIVGSGQHASMTFLNSHGATNTIMSTVTESGPMTLDLPVSEPSASPEVASEESLHFDYPGSDIVLRSCDSSRPLSRVLSPPTHIPQNRRNGC